MLKHNLYEGDIFFIRNDQKIEGMYHGVARLNQHQLKGIVECIDLTIAAYPIPRNLRERLEKRLLPRFYEIKNVLNSKQQLPKELGVEIIKLNQEDILYGLNSTIISRQIADRGYDSNDLRNVIFQINFGKSPIFKKIK